MRGHQLLDLADDLRTEAKLEITAPDPFPIPCCICGGEPAIIEHPPIGPSAAFCWADYRARRLGESEARVS